MSTQTRTHGRGSALAPARARLSFARTVECGLAHRRALGEVFVADSTEVADNEFLVAIQIPRAHSLWFDRRAPYHDTLATIEASRQAVFVIVHRHLGVPIGPPFTLHTLDFRVHDLEAYRDDEASPFDAIWHARLFDRTEQDGILVGLRLEGALMVDGARAATLGGQVAFLPQREYDLMRAAHRARVAGAPPPMPAGRVDPALVGRFDRRNVVIADAGGGRFDRRDAAVADAGGGRFDRRDAAVADAGRGRSDRRDAAPADAAVGRFLLVADERHPSFYDHPQDHVPGPLIIEAYRQAAVLTAHRAGALPTPVAAVTRCRASFSDFCEPDAPALCSATLTGGSRERATVEIALEQFDRRIAEGEIELAEYP